MTLGIALLGTGRIAETAFVPAVGAVDGAGLVAVLSRDRSRGEAFAARHGIAGAYSDLDALLADPAVDAVIVATPDATHEPQVVAAARAGKHILCEKPMATTPEACERMAEAVRAAGVTFAMGFSNRYNSGLQRIKQLLDEGAVGTVRHARSLLTTPQSDPEGWRAAGEQSLYWALSASGTHVIDVYRWFFGDPAGVAGVLARPLHDGANDEIATVVLDYPGRMLAELTVSAILPRGANRLEIHGEEGVIVGDGAYNRGPDRAISLNGEPVEVEPAELFTGEVGDFVAAIAGGREPRATLEDGLRNVRIMDAARRSAPLRPVG